MDLHWKRRVLTTGPPGSIKPITFWNSESYFSDTFKLECSPLESQPSLICSNAVRRRGFLYYIDQSSKKRKKKLTETHKRAESTHFTNHWPKTEGCGASEKMEEKKRKWLKVIVLKAWVLFTSRRQFRFELRSVVGRRSTHGAHQERAALPRLVSSELLVGVVLFHVALVTLTHVTRTWKTFGKMKALHKWDGS